MAQIQEKIDTTSCGCCVIKFVGDTPHILLVKPFKSRESWGIPKGHIEPDESHEACAKREVYEETGVSVRLIARMSPVKTSYATERKTVISFLAVQTDPEVQPTTADGENHAVEYFPLESLPSIHVYQRPLLAEVTEAVNKLGRETFE